MEYSVSAVRNTCFAILSSIETDLRDVIGYAALKAGDVDILPEDVRKISSERFTQDNKDRPDVIPENDLDLLPYTDFADLSKMLHAKSKLLEIEYGQDVTKVAQEIERMARARNRVCHSRPLEEDDLPKFLDLAKRLLVEFKDLPWNELRRFQELKEKDPTFVLRLQIPNFWQAGNGAIRNNIPYPDFDETSFLGRLNERRDIQKHILGPHPITTVVGEGGVGKTALVVYCLYEILDIAGPPLFDAIVFLSLKSPHGDRNRRDS